MAKAVFYIKDKVQEVGYRAFAMERLLETNLKGGAVNTEEGNLKVLLDGGEQDIVAFVERLKREKPGLAENPVLVGPIFDEGLQIPDEIRFAHSLEMNQFGKAIVYLDRIDKKLDNGFNSLGDKLGGIDKKLDKGFESLGNKIDNLGNRLEPLLKEILHALKARA